MRQMQVKPRFVERGGWSEPLSYEKLFDDKNKLKHFEDGVVALSLEDESQVI